MIEYWEGRHGLEMFLSQNEEAIIFDASERSRVIQVLERGLNTLSPPDMELIKLLEDMKK